MPKIAKYPEEFQFALHQQSRLGWHRLYQGIFAVSWEGFRPSSHTSGNLWIRSLILQFFQMSEAIWRARNKNWHSDDPSSSDVRTKDLLLNSLCELYALRPSVHPRDRRYYLSSLEDQLEKPVSYIQQWISVYGPIL